MAPPSWGAGALSIRQLVIVTLSGILREVLDELPIVALGIVEVHALAVRMCIRRCGISVSGGLHSVAQRLDIVDLIGEMVHARQPLIWSPVLRGLHPRLTQGNVGFMGTYVDPSCAIGQPA